MKRKLMLVLLSMALLFTACGNDSKTPDNAQEGDLPIHQAYQIYDGRTFTDVNELAATLFSDGQPIFRWYHIIPADDLEVDWAEENRKEEYFLPVGRFGTMAELKAATETVFTKAFCEAQFYDKIEELKLFKEIDGKLYINDNVGGIGWLYSPPLEFEVEAEAEDGVILRFTFERPSYDLGDGVDVLETRCTIVKEDGFWKLNDYYSYTAEGYDDGRIVVVEEAA